MGNGIAHVFAQSGFKVTLVDVRETALEKAIATIGRNLDRLIKKEKISEADKAATREQETTVRVGYEASQAAQAVPLTRQIAHQLTASAQKANTAATLAGKAYAEGETLLTNWLQARRQARETQLAATLAQVNAEEAAARAQLDAHQLWTPPPLDSSSHDFSIPHGELKP